MTNKSKTASVSNNDAQLQREAELASMKAWLDADRAYHNKRIADALDKAGFAEAAAFVRSAP